MKFDEEVRKDIVKREKLFRASFDNIKNVIEKLFAKNYEEAFVSYNGHAIEVYNTSKHVYMHYKKIPLVYSYYFSKSKIKNNGEIQIYKFVRDLSYYLYMNTDYRFFLNGQVICIKNSKDGIHE